MPLDAARYPRLAAYVDALPSGLGSYPECRTKASVYREALADKPLDDPRRLPDELFDLIARPRLFSTWVEAARVQAFFLAIADHHGMSDDVFGEWSYRLQKRLYSGPLYRSLMALASPPLLLTGTRMRWGSIHRGSDIEVETRGREAIVRLLFPRNLYAPTNLVGFASGFRGVVELSNAAFVRVGIADVRATRADFSVQWR